MVPLDPAAQRKFAVEVVEKLREGGFLAYWAGGCVRDQLLGRVPKDYDVATDAHPEQIRELFGKRRTLAIGAAFGVITVLGPKDTAPIEVATFRQDATYSDGRHPDDVTFSTPHEDAKRRDFTINGLFYDPHAQHVIDFVEGQQDLERRLVRAIGEPRERFREDKLRLLRAVRFTATLEFEMEAATRAAVQEMASEIGVVSVERIAAELRSILTHPSRRRGLELLNEVGLLAAILPEIVLAVQQSPMAWQDTLGILALLEEPGFPLALAALLHRLVPVESIDSLAHRLKLSNAETKRTTWLVESCKTMAHPELLPWPQLQRLLIAEGIEDLLALLEAQARLEGRATIEIERCRQRLALPAEELNPPPLVTGNDLIAHGLKPGSDFPKLLEAIRDAQLVGTVATKEAALKLVDRLRGENRDQ